jgi:DNA-binding CsgD family transcriptional regulator
VAGLAAAGVPSKEIADQLFLSARTVDNHLLRVYQKLGVGGRTELAAALRALGDPVGAARTPAVPRPRAVRDTRP